MIALLQNKSLRKLTLKRLDLGLNIEMRQHIADLVVYNENIDKLNLAGNSIQKIRPIFENLVRNRNSNLQKFVLSENDMEVYDVKDILRTIDKDSLYGQRQHFKLRFLTISNCKPLISKEREVKALLDDFYKQRRKVFISFRNEEVNALEKDVEEAKQISSK